MVNNFVKPNTQFDFLHIAALNSHNQIETIKNKQLQFLQFITVSIKKQKLFDSSFELGGGSKDNFCLFVQCRRNTREIVTLQKI